LKPNIVQKGEGLAQGISDTFGGGKRTQKRRRTKIRPKMTQGDVKVQTSISEEVDYLTQEEKRRHDG